jgi:hypothetical protein
MDMPDCRESALPAPRVQCYTAEKTRPPATPVTTGPLKVAVKEGDALWLCACGQSAKYP